MKKPYRDNVSLKCIIEDGWSRGFMIEQTVDEAKVMGYSTSIEEVQKQWDILTRGMETYFKGA